MVGIVRFVTMSSYFNSYVLYFFVIFIFFRDKEKRVKASREWMQNIRGYNDSGKIVVNLGC